MRNVKVAIETATHWELHKETLSQALVDYALNKIGGEYNAFGMGKVSIKGKHFVISCYLER